MPSFSNVAAYQFVPLTDLGPLRGRLLALCKSWGLRGTILLSPEGINLFVAGEPDKVELLLRELRSQPGLADLQAKISESDHQPFNRMLVRIKKEIIAFGIEGISPSQRTSPKLSPRTLKQWLDEGRRITLLDTRNDYEVKLGTFKSAMSLGLDHFRNFPAAVRQLPSELKEEAVVMFCTGGIRCEKAGPFMEREGFKNVFQLEGGILKYFQECGAAHYNGECFVFDQRVGVDGNLQETDSTQCFVCLTPLNKAEQADSRYVPGKSCPHCFQTPEQRMAAIIDRRHAQISRVTIPLPGSQPYDKCRPLNIPSTCNGRTLIEVFAQMVPHVSREAWEAQCANGMLLDDQYQPVAAAKLVRTGERYLHKTPDVVEPAVNGNVRVLHEDEALIVLNKPAPLPMHVGGRFNRNTLQYLLNQVYYPEKPKPAHRLDANTTGVVLFTRTRYFAGLLQPQFARGQVEKTYLVRVQGQPVSDAFSCDAPISAESCEVGTREVNWETGLPSRTEFRVLRRHANGSALLEARPLTGRTNQIRVHLWHLGFPVCGDPAYLAGQKIGTIQTLGIDDPPLCLHSWRIQFEHPLTRQQIEFKAPPPDWVEGL
jgi:UPF0176 protein